MALPANLHLLAQNAVDMGNLSGPGTAVSSGTDATTAAEKIVSQVIGALTVVAIIWFAIQIILAGYAFLTSEGDEKKMETARRRLTDGVLGLVIVIVAVALGSLIAKLAGVSNAFDLNGFFNTIGK